MIDVYFTYALFLLVIFIIIAYQAKLKFVGHETYGRVEKQGASLLLPKNIMEMGYWMFQPIGDICIKYQISPNQITWISASIGVFSALFLAFGMFGVAAALLAISSTMDGLDGLVARKTGQTSLAGEILDSSLDRYVDFCFLAGLAIYYRESVVLLIITLFAILGSFMISYSTAKAEAIQVTPPRGNMKRSERIFYLLLGAMFSSITVAYFETDNIGIPMVIVLLLIAVMANLSAFQRLKALTIATEKNEQKEKLTSQ